MESLDVPAKIHIPYERNLTENENVDNGTKRKYARDKSEDSLQIEQEENNSNLKESVSEGPLKRKKFNENTTTDKFICNDCGAALCKNSHLQDHIIGVHFNLKPFECLQCKKSFTNITKLRYHIENKHQSSSNIDFSGLKCNDCGAFYNSGHKHYLKAHIDEAHKKLNKFECEYCNASFSQKVHLQDHLDRIHDFHKNPTNNFSCSQCETSFENMQHREDHINTVHLKIKPYKCIHCEMSFSQMFRKKQHVNNNHLYPCKRCWEAYYTWNNLRLHVNDVHLELKGQHCRTCKKFPLEKFSCKLHDPSCLLRC